MNANSDRISKLFLRCLKSMNNINAFENIDTKSKTCFLVIIKSKVLV